MKKINIIFPSLFFWPVFPVVKTKEKTHLKALQQKIMMLQRSIFLLHKILLSLMTKVIRNFFDHIDEKFVALDQKHTENSTPETNSNANKRFIKHQRFAWLNDDAEKNRNSKQSILTSTTTRTPKTKR